MKHTLLFALSFCLAFSCDSTFDASRLDNDLTNTTWLFLRAETDNGDVFEDATSSRRATIEFGDRAANSAAFQVNGYNGCNAFSGDYSVDADGELVFTNIAQTERACREEEARVENAFNRGILGARTFTIEGDVLVINAPNESVKLRLSRVGEEMN